MHILYVRTFRSSQSDGEKAETFDYHILNLKWKMQTVFVYILYHLKTKQLHQFGPLNH